MVINGVILLLLFISEVINFLSSTADDLLEKIVTFVGSFILYAVVVFLLKHYMFGDSILWYVLFAVIINPLEKLLNKRKQEKSGIC